MGEGVCHVGAPHSRAKNVPAAVAFCVNNRTCAWRSSICLCVSAASLGEHGRPIPQFGQAEWACDIVRVIVVDMEGSCDGSAVMR